MAAPVRKGEELELRIDSLAFGGSGVARHDGFVVFVRGGVPGDDVRARITKVKRGFAEGIVTELVHSSDSRVAAPCRHFGVCGGCRFQDLAYSVQLSEKERQVRDALVRIGRFAEPPLDPIVPAASQFAYRNKLEYSFTSGEDGVDLGFHRAGRWDEVIGIEECLLTTDVGNAIRLAVRGWAREEQLEAYDQDNGSGYLRHLVVREGRNTGQALVVLVTAPGERFEAGYLVDVLRRFPEVRSIHWAINDTPAEQTNLPTKLLWGEDAIEEEILGLRFRVRPSAFLQTNTEMAERLYELAREYAGLSGEENVFDLYCGTGTIGLALARKRGFSVGCRDLRRSRRLRDRERGAQRHRQRAVLRRERRPVDRGAPRGGGKPRRRDRRSPASGSCREGAPANGGARRLTDRLRLVQSDHARLGSPGAP